MSRAFADSPAAAESLQTPHGILPEGRARGGCEQRLAWLRLLAWPHPFKNAVAF